MNADYYNGILDEFKRYNPYMAHGVADWRPRGDMGIRVVMKDGSRYDYNTITKSVRKVQEFIANDIRDITDEYCRSALAYNLSERMALKGYSQHTLAEDTGLSKGTIYNYLNQKATATSTALRKMARVLDCTVDELLS